MKLITDKPSYIIDPELDIGQSNWDAPNNLALGQIAMENLFRTVALEPNSAAIPFKVANRPLDIETMTFDDPLMQGRTISGEQLLNRRIFNDALMVMHRGKVIHESYRNGMTADDRHVIHSCTKSLCSMLVAIAIEEGLVDSKVELSTYLPEFVSYSAWQGVTIQHVLDMQAGIEFNEDYSDPDAHYWDYTRAAGYYPTLDGEPAIGAKVWAYQNLNIRNYKPGTTFVYNSCLANILGMVLEVVYQQDLAVIFEQKLYQRCGVESDAYFNTDPQGFPITEGQFNCRLRDFARCASLMINEGKNLNDEQIIPAEFITELVQVDTEAQHAYQAEHKDDLFTEGQYHNQFWVLNPNQKQFSMLGIHGQFAWFDLNRNLMIVGMSSYPVQDCKLMMSSLNTLWQTIAKTV